MKDITFLTSWISKCLIITKLNILVIILKICKCILKNSDQNLGIIFRMDQTESATEENEMSICLTCRACYVNLDPYAHS